ncbi:BnaC03g23400D [Brassica napus]|uniref:(rape) hypothetical protein n=1 Tax=Brassica napus TaxID=3708 RepID=A0A078G7W0_BRANA|nr:unnamed protein product [Brassica napus]CDY22530.1 BnaC03g23400D [Brassica napus]
MEASPSKVLVSLGPLTNLLAFLLTPGLRVGLRVYAGDSPGRMSPIFKSAVLAKYYGEKKRPQKVKKEERTQAKCSVLEEGQVSRRQTSN